MKHETTTRERFSFILGSVAGGLIAMWQPWFLLGYIAVLTVLAVFIAWAEHMERRAQHRVREARIAAESKAWVERQEQIARRRMFDA